MATESNKSSNNSNRGFALSQSDSTNLMLGLRKSIFTTMRSSFTVHNDKTDKDDTVYEYWVKCPPESSYYSSLSSKMIANGFVCMGCYGSDDIASLTRPDSHPKKVMFDSCRTALVERLLLNGNYAACNFVGNWAYAGSTKDHSDGNFSLYGYIFHDKEDESFHVANCSTRQQDANTLKDLSWNHGCYISNVAFDFSGKIAEIKDFEIVSNDTPEQNTYYVAVEDRNGNLLDVFTTTTFGVTVGSLIGNYASSFSDKVQNTRVTDDLMLKIGKTK